MFEKDMKMDWWIGGLVDWWIFGFEMNFIANSKEK